MISGQWFQRKRSFKNLIKNTQNYQLPIKPEEVAKRA